MNHWVLWCCDAVSFTVRSKSWDRQLWGLSVPLSCYKWTAWCNGDGERTHLHLYWSSQWALVSLRYFLCHSHWNTAARFTAQRVHFTFPKQLGERCWDRISAVFINTYIRIYWRQDRRRRDVCVCVCVSLPCVFVGLLPGREAVCFLLTISRFYFSFFVFVFSGS